MGAACVRPEWSSSACLVASDKVPVTLHVYDIGNSSQVRAINGALRPLGLGLFHCGVEVYDWEWSYSLTSNDMSYGTGVFCCRPQQCECFHHTESVSLGKTRATEREVLRTISMLEKKWVAAEYDTLRHNCSHFCNEFCRMLGTALLPKWVTKLALTASRVATAQEAVEKRACFCCRHPAKVDEHDDWKLQLINL